MRRLLLILIGAALLGAASVQAAEPQQGGRLVVGLVQEPVTLDPHVTGQAVVRRIFTNVVDTLVYADDEGGIHPFLAESWDISDDGLTYTFHLRDDVTFHDGTPFNAEAMHYSFERIMDPETGSQSAISAIEPYESSEVVDEFTLRVHLSEPSAIWLRSTASHAVAPVSPAAVEELGDAEFGRRPVSTGPFRIVEWVDNEAIYMERHEDYSWGPEVLGHDGPAYMDELVIAFIPEDQVRLGTLETGETNVIEDVPSRFVQMLEDDPNFDVLSVPYPGAPQQVMINVQRPPTDELAVRQAILHTVNGEAIVESLHAGVFPPGNGPLSVATWGAVEGLYRQFYPQDAEAARNLLEEAGWELGGDGVRVRDGERLSILVNVNADIPEYGDLAQILQAQLGDIGMEVELLRQARSPWFATNETGDYNLVPMGIWRTDPHMLSLLYRTDGSTFAWSHYSNPEFDELVDEGARTVDAERRLEIYREAQEIVMGDALTLPLWDQLNLLGVQADIDGIVFDENAFPRYHQAHFLGN